MTIEEARAGAERLQQDLRADGPCYSRASNHKRDHCRDCIMWEAADLLAVLSAQLGQCQEALEELRAHADYSLDTSGQRTRPPLFVPSVAKRVLEIIDKTVASALTTAREE